MKIEEFDYHLPEELIAQKPSPKREESRMMVLIRKERKILHLKFKDIVDFLSNKDMVVINNTKVLPARLFGKKRNGGAKVEVLLVRKVDQFRWITLVKPGKRLKTGSEIEFKDEVSGKVVEILENGERVIQFNISEKKFLDFLFREGVTPLPPYIKEAKKLPEEFHRNRYQTIFAKEYGSVAAPTAGLHFSRDILNKLKVKGVKLVEITLHVGPGTFKPVVEENIENHRMDEEFFLIRDEVAKKINEHKKRGGYILAVGTTTTRTLETIAKKYNGILKGEMGFTKLFIYPPYEFKIVDKLITNFHLPKSTLLMLVSAFAGKEFIMQAYHEAIKEKYRFYSYGDCMLII